MPDLRIGLVGPGTIGQTHRTAIAHVHGLKLVAIAGGTPEELGHFAPTSEMALFPDTAAMLAGAALDAVVIATPSGMHYAPTKLALEAGLHVMVEKPLAVSLAEARELAVLARTHGRVCATVSQRRLEAQHADIHRRLQAGELGAPLLIEGRVHWFRSEDYYGTRPWRRLGAQGGGSLFNQGIHTLDLMLWLFGPLREVTAVTGRLAHRHEAEDTSCAILSFANGALGTIVTTTATPPGLPAELSIFTAHGSLSLKHTDLVRWDYPGLPPPPPADAAITSGAGSMVSIGTAGHADQWTDFRDAIREGRDPAITFVDSLRTVEAITAIYRSAELGRAVRLEELKELDA